MSGYHRHVSLVLIAAAVALACVGCVSVRNTPGPQPSSEARKLGKLQATAEAFLKTSADLHTLTGEVRDFEELPEGYSIASGSILFFIIPPKRIEGFGYWVGSEKGDFYVQVTVATQWRTRVTGWKARPMKTLEGKVKNENKEVGQEATGA